MSLKHPPKTVLVTGANGYSVFPQFNLLFSHLIHRQLGQKMASCYIKIDSLKDYY